MHVATLEVMHNRRAYRTSVYTERRTFQHGLLQSVFLSFPIDRDKIHPRFAMQCGFSLDICTYCTCCRNTTVPA